MSDKQLLWEWRAELDRGSLRERNGAPRPRTLQDGTRREWLFDDVSDASGTPLQPRTPDTVLEALMETAPHDEPALSHQELEPIRAALADALDELDPELRDVFDMNVVWGRSTRAIAATAGVGRMVVRGRLARAKQQLRETLEQSDIIQEWITSK